MLRDCGGAAAATNCTKFVRYLLIYGREIFDRLGHQARSFDSIYYERSITRKVSNTSLKRRLSSLLCLAITPTHAISKRPQP
jgi:hypothetical protein